MSVIVAGIVISNTLAILLAQRRETALLRSVLLGDENEAGSHLCCGDSVAHLVLGVARGA